MLKYAALFAGAGMLALSVLSHTVPPAGSWRVDTRHSDAQLITDATTDYGRTKLDVTLGFARVNGKVTLDEGSPSKSSVDLRIYPATATSMSPCIDEDGAFLNHWLAKLSSHTLMCFHSKHVVQTPDGRLQAMGDLVLTRVDRPVEATPSQGYSGPIYGAPMVHRVSHEATFVFDLPAGDAKGQKDGGVVASGSTKMFREDFPQLLKAVVNTYWPVVVQDEACQAAPNPGGQDYYGSQCTGTLLEAPGLPEAPSNGQDVGVVSNYNAVVGDRLNILLHLHLTTKGAGEAAAGGV